MAPSTSDRGKHRKGNALAIRLTESAVFLPIDTFAPVRRRLRQPEPRTSTLRGLLVLDLVKPTKISSIDIELTAVTSTAWPEGVGARRIDVTEDHQVFRASTVFFSGSSHPTAAASRRTASIGPGISYARFDGHGSSPEPDDDSLDEPDLDGWTYLQRRSGPGADTAQTIPLPLSPPPPFVEGNSAGGPSHDISSGTPSEISVRPPLQPRQSSRRFSVDGNHFRPRPLYETRHEVQEFYGNLSRSELESLAPIPPYSPYPPESTLSVPAASGVVSPTAGPAQSLEEFRNSLHSSLRSSQLHLTEPSPTGSALSLTSASAPASAEGPGLISRQVGATAGEAQARSSPVPRRRSLSSTRTSAANRPSHSASTLPPIQAQDIEPPSPSSAPFHERHASPLSAQREPDRDKEHRGRKRFSLTGLFKTSHSVGKILPSRERPQETSSTGRALSVDTDAERFPRRPSPTDRESSALEDMDEEPEEDYRRHRSKERGRRTISRIIKGNLIDGGREKEDWKEFKPGTYSYPISFTIPADSPPSMRCEYGSVVWQLKANVHRPGAFKTKLTATREVTVIACPTEEDTEDTENIIVERHWEQQLQYLIAVSGRSFYIGGTMPVMLTLMPLTKMKIYRLSIYIEERVDYYTNMRRIARTDLPSRICLLSVKAGRSSEPILPLDSDSPDALRNSPLFSLLDPHASDLELSETVSTLMGPGPWTFHQNLQLPRSCDELHFTNRNRRSNIEVTHLLKVVMRVQRGDDTHLDPKTGKRKLFDIVVQTPVLILSCRCNPEWMGLPRYAEALEDTTLIVPSCPCQDERTRLLTGQPAGPFGSGAFLERITSRRSSDNESACGSGGEATVVHPRSPAAIQLANYTDTMLQSNELFERLVSGQESVSGEVPPAYAPPPAGRVLAGTGVGVI